MHRSAGGRLHITVVVDNSFGLGVALGLAPCAKSSLLDLCARASLASVRSLASAASPHHLADSANAPSAGTTDLAPPTAAQLGPIATDDPSTRSPQAASVPSPTGAYGNQRHRSFHLRDDDGPRPCCRPRHQLLRMHGRGGVAPRWCPNPDTHPAFRTRLPSAATTTNATPAAMTAPLPWPGPGSSSSHATLAYRSFASDAPLTTWSSSSSCCGTGSSGYCRQATSWAFCGGASLSRNGAGGAASGSSGSEAGLSAAGGLDYSLPGTEYGRGYSLRWSWPPLLCRTRRPAAAAGHVAAAATAAAAAATTPGVERSARWPWAPYAVRLLHSTSGRGVTAGEGGGGGGCRTAQPRRATPREEGLGAPMDVFDRPLKARHRDRSAALLDAEDPLMGAVTERLLDRLEDCRSRSFPTAVVLGGAAVPVLHQLAGSRAGIERVVVVDPSQAMLDRVKREEAESRRRPGSKPWPRVLCVRGDEEHLPLKPKSVNLIISCLGLHWANDLPGAMAQCRMALVPDGLFLAALFGGDTLQELRISCALAQMEREGGVSAVVSPLTQVRDAGNLLTRADLRLPTVDVDRFHLGYPSPLELVNHLRALGESNASTQRRRMLSRDSALAAAAVYQSMFGNDDGSVSATYEVIFMTGWSPSEHQPKAAKRGSATVSFQDLAEGLVKGGAAVGGTADGDILTGTEPEGSVTPTKPPPLP